MKILWSVWQEQEDKSVRNTLNYNEIKTQKDSSSSQLFDSGAGYEGFMVFGSILEGVFIMLNSWGY